MSLWTPWAIWAGAGSAVAMAAFAMGRLHAGRNPDVDSRSDRPQQTTPPSVPESAIRQDELMRLKEREIINQQLLKLESSVLLTRGNPEDLDDLIGRIDRRIEAASPDQAAECVSRFSTHLRNVFMASDQPWVPADQAADQVGRWVKFLDSLEAVRIAYEVPDKVRSNARDGARANVLLLLSVVEQWGMCALRQEFNKDGFSIRWETSDGGLALICEGVSATLKADHPLVQTIFKSGGFLRSEPGLLRLTLPWGKATSHSA
jgi:hypothetical protein